MQKQELSDKEQLIVYKASAGSGKTHQLTEEYLLLLFKTPFAYKHILAVTFTNKATEEMKSRIIKELAYLASDKKSEHLKKLCEAYNKPQEAIQAQARQILTTILHDYSAFSISTIDRFFQQTMRSFTREIGLGGGYNVELDKDKVLRLAIDSMLYDLEQSGNEQLLDWLIRFSEEKIEGGETWNIRNDIHALSSEIFKESYKESSDEIQQDISNKELLNEYKQTLLQIIREFEQTSKQIAQKALHIVSRLGLHPEDFKGGSRSTFISFVKWYNGEIKEPTDTFRKTADNIANWYTKTTASELKSKIEQSYTEGLNDCVVSILAHYDNSYMYQTAYEINRYFFALGILGDVDKKIREYAAENNVMLISDTTELLTKIIQGADSPFIYEKVGTRIENYMIDEFQDTSGMQWANFLPLVKDSVSAGNKNLIVGDVKQSIYRWRNSDWKLLDEQIDLDFKNNAIRHQSLTNNWRSCKHVIDFNNAIFESSSILLQQLFNDSTSNTATSANFDSFTNRIRRAYADSYQYIPDKKRETIEDGHVKIEFIDTEEHTDWKQHALQQLPHTIEQLQDSGYSLKDIAILVRTKREGAEVANILLEYKGLHSDSSYKYDIISDEALFIRNSKSIKFIISLLHYLRNPFDRTLQALAIYEYYKFKDNLVAEEAIRSHFSLDHNFPEAIRQELNRIKELPLYEMVEEIFNLFNEALDKNENIYIQAFLDTILDFTIKRVSDLDSFLVWWEESGQNQTIYTPDGQDAIRIMTIHKSKGLEFKAVLIPFCNWEIDHKMPVILWCKPQIQPFDLLKLVPVKYSQKLSNTLFAYEYYNEKLHAFIDNLNILYVAFTRAVKDLIIFTPKPKETPKNINSISSLLWACIYHPLADTANKTFIKLDASLNGDNNTFELGNSVLQYPQEMATIQKNELKVDAIKSTPFDDRLKLKLNNKYFFSDKGQREYGTLMHEIVSKIKSLDEMEDVLETYKLGGYINQQEQLKLAELLHQYLSNPQLSEWYSNKYKVLNEIQILQPNGIFIRPDRVMIGKDEVIVIDYKFGEKEEKKHQKQVKNYMAQISKMGYTHIKGYVCYISLGTIIEIDR
ncbi:MAG: hypothetical protein RL662_2263 [Bacteroidota bacterium]|jgi:ATP-dependent exoDNAse (exonuclease V) beta subunit